MNKAVLQVISIEGITTIVYYLYTGLEPTPDTPLLSTGSSLAHKYKIRMVAAIKPD
jgi:hypothetical protein